MLQYVFGTLCLPTFDRWPKRSSTQKVSPDNSTFPVRSRMRSSLGCWVHFDMIITRESIHEAEELVASSDVHYEVNPGQGKVIFRASPVNIGKVNAKSPFAICLLDENHISQPVGIIYFSDSSGLEEFADLFVKAFCLSGVKLLLFRLTGLKEGMTFSLWVITVGSIPPMSSCFQANSSTFCFKKRMRKSLTSSTNLDPM